MPSTRKSSVHKTWPSHHVRSFNTREHPRTSDQSVNAGVRLRNHKGFRGQDTDLDGGGDVFLRRPGAAVKDESARTVLAGLYLLLDEVLSRSNHIAQSSFTCHRNRGLQVWGTSACQRTSTCCHHHIGGIPRMGVLEDYRVVIDHEAAILLACVSHS